MQEMLPHRDHVMLESVDVFAEHMVVTEREAGVPQLAVWRIDGLEEGEKDALND